jgi:hypothetical protein
MTVVARTTAWDQAGKNRQQRKVERSKIDTFKESK